MAIGRRKRLGSGTLGIAIGDMVVAGAAPTDGSARVSATLTLCNRDTAARTVDVAITDSANTILAYLLQGFSIPAKDTYVHNATIDLMGTEKLRGLASAASVLDFNVFGVEAKDS